MEIKKIEELLTNRYNNLTEREKDAFIFQSFWHDERLHQYFNGIRKDIDWKNAYAWSLLGRGFHKAKDRKSTRLNSSHSQQSRMPSSA